MAKFLQAVLCVATLLPFCHGAERVSAKSLLQRALHRRQMTSEPLTSYRFKRNADVIPMTELGEALALDSGATLEVVRESVTVQGTRVVKMQERFKGRLIPDAVVTLETDDEGRHVMDASGSVYRNIDLDFEESSQLDPEQAKRLCLQYNSDQMAATDVLYEKAEQEVLFEADGQAYAAYLTQYLVTDEGGRQRRPTCLIDARDSRVMVSWDDIDTCSDCSAKGVGGNLKIGKIRYGELQRCLDLRRENGVCYLENQYVRVVNNNFTLNLTTEEEGDSHAVVGSYNCLDIDDFVNGGYSPLLDALFYGTVVGKMFETWYDTSPLGERMVFRVHWGVNFTNAFWNGHECTFGDGNGVFHYPLVSLDIVGHEIAHGITEKNSNLYYYQQWGCINEAFSDMTGETAEAYLSEADWMMGVDITAEDVPPFRYFSDPTKDNMSISHADNFTDFLDPHLGSGVYNRAFYLLVHDYGLPIKDVYGVFLHANKMYWHHMSDYQQAACDVMKSAYDLGQDGSRFREAFRQVGVEVCDAEDHVLGLKHKHVYRNVKVSRAVSPTFVFTVPGEFAESVTVNSSSSSGGIYIILSDKKWGGRQEHVTVYAEGLHSVTYQLAENVTMTVSITLTTDSVTPLNDVTITAAYNCRSNFSLEEKYSSYVLYWHWLMNCAANEDKGSDDDDESNDDDGGGDDEEESDEKDSSEEEGKEDKDEEGEEEKEEGKEDNMGEEGEDEFPSKSMSVSGHVFNFFKSFVIMIFPQYK